MDACLSTNWEAAPQWSNNLHQQNLEMTTPGGSIWIHDSSMAAPGYAWGESAPPSLLMTSQQHQLLHQQQQQPPLTMLLNGPLESGLMGHCVPFDGPKGTTTTTSGGGSMDHLLSGSTTNTADTTSNNSTEDDDGTISRIFTECHNLLNFSTPSIATATTNHNPKKRANDEAAQGSGGGVGGGGGGGLLFSNDPRKKFKIGPKLSSSSNINFQQGGGVGSSDSSIEEPDSEAIQQMKEMIYRAAAFRPVNFGVEMVDRPKRKNVRISSDPQTVAARQRRERISERLRVLQKLVPGGSKMDTASMLDEAANYLKFLRNQVKALEAFGNKVDHHHYSPPNHSSNSSLNLQFSSLQQQPLMIPMQAHHHYHHHHPTFSLQNPNNHQQMTHIVPKS